MTLTHGALGSDGHRLQQHLDDPGSDPRHVLVVGVQVVQNLLDDVVGVLSLQRGGGGGGRVNGAPDWLLS